MRQQREGQKNQDVRKEDWSRGHGQDETEQGMKGIYFLLIRTYASQSTKTRKRGENGEIGGGRQGPRTERYEKRS